MVQVELAKLFILLSTFKGQVFTQISKASLHALNVSVLKPI